MNIHDCIIEGNTVAYGPPTKPMWIIIENTVAGKIQKRVKEWEGVWLYDSYTDKEERRLKTILQEPRP